MSASDVVTYWPIIVSAIATAAVWGDMRRRVSTLDERLAAVEDDAQHERQRLAEALEAIRLDIREIKTVLKLRDLDAG